MRTSLPGFKFSSSSPSNFSPSQEEEQTVYSTARRGEGGGATGRPAIEMNVCFRGGAGDSRAARSIGAIRGLAKNMKAMSLKAKAAGGAGHARRRERREADPRERYKDGSGSTSAKIAPAQLQDDRRHDHRLHMEEGCDKCGSPSLDLDADDAAEKDGNGADEWVAEPEPGVLMTLAPRPDGTNRLRKVRFRDELFDDWAAQSWWADNHDRIVELYSLVNQSDGDGNDDAPVTPCQSESDEEEPLPDAMAASEPSSGSRSSGTAGSPILGLVTAPDTLRGCKMPPTVTSTPKAVAPAAHEDDVEEDGDISDHHQRNTPWTEWVEEYEPGVFITVRAYPDHPLQLRHVELSREKFGEVKARVWWQENKDRLRSLYSF